MLSKTIFEPTHNFPVKMLQSAIQDYCIFFDEHLLSITSKNLIDHYRYCRMYLILCKGI